MSTSKDTTLVFESRFESGNLNLAVKVSNLNVDNSVGIAPIIPKNNVKLDEYNLILQNDTNTHGHTQCK